MMTCDAIRNRLLAEPDPARVPEDLRPHLLQCAGCKDFLARYEVLAERIAALPTPDSELAKLAFLHSITQAGPIITARPALQDRGSSFAPIWRSARKPLAYSAAVVAVGVGIWAAVPRRTPAPEYAAPRHELLKKVVDANTALAKASDPKARIATLSTLAGDLRGETNEMALYADEADLASLAGLFDDVVSKGLVAQAKQLNPLTVSPADRQGLLTAAADKLAVAADDAAALARRAPPAAQASLRKIADSATQGRTRLLAIARGEGA